MLSNLFTGAAQDLRRHGWTQPNAERPQLFYHPEFGTHDFFKACYLDCNIKSIRRRRRLISTACWIGIGLLLWGALLLIFTAVLGVCYELPRITT